MIEENCGVINVNKSFHYTNNYIHLTGVYMPRRTALKYSSGQSGLKKCFPNMKIDTVSDEKYLER